MSAEYGLQVLLKQLLLAARQFEAVAAKHRKAEPARQALREAMTRAEFVLSVFERHPVPTQRNGLSSLARKKNRPPI